MLKRACHPQPLVVPAAIAIVVSGCTAIPTKEFASYREAFAHKSLRGQAYTLYPTTRVYVVH
jgi:hypothetical protein